MGSWPSSFRRLNFSFGFLKLETMKANSGLAWPGLARSRCGCRRKRGLERRAKTSFDGVRLARDLEVGSSHALTVIDHAPALVKDPHRPTSASTSAHSAASFCSFSGPSCAKANSEKNHTLGSTFLALANQLGMTFELCAQRLTQTDLDKGKLRFETRTELKLE